MSGPAGGYALAQAFVRISPNTDQFRERTLTGVETALTGISPTIKVDANIMEAEAEVDELVAYVDTVASKLTDLRLTASDKDVQATLARVYAQLLAIDTVIANPEIEVGGIVRAQAAILGMDVTLDKLADKVTVLGIDVSDAPAEVKLAALRVQLIALANESGRIPLDFDDPEAVATVTALRAAIGELYNTLGNADLGVTPTDRRDPGSGLFIAAAAAEAAAQDRVTATLEASAAAVEALQDAYRAAAGVADTAALAETADAAALAAMYDALAGKLEDLTLTANDKPLEATIAKAAVQLGALGDIVSSPQLTVAGAVKAEAQMLAIEVLFDRVAGKVAALGIIVDDGSAEEKLAALRVEVMALGAAAAAIPLNFADPGAVATVVALRESIGELYTSLEHVDLGVTPADSRDPGSGAFVTTAAAMAAAQARVTEQVATSTAAVRTLQDAYKDVTGTAETATAASAADAAALTAMYEALAAKLGDLTLTANDKPLEASIAKAGLQLGALGDIVSSPELTVDGAAKAQVQMLAIGVLFDAIAGKIAALGIVVEDGDAEATLSGLRVEVMALAASAAAIPLNFADPDAVAEVLALRASITELYTTLAQGGTGGGTGTAALTANIASVQTLQDAYKNLTRTADTATAATAADAAALTALYDTLAAKLGDLTLTANDKPLEAAIAKAALKLGALGDIVSSPELTVDGAAKANAEMLAIGVQADALAGKIITLGIIPAGDDETKLAALRVEVMALAASAAAIPLNFSDPKAVAEVEALRLSITGLYASLSAMDLSGGTDRVAAQLTGATAAVRVLQGAYGGLSSAARDAGRGAGDLAGGVAAGTQGVKLFGGALQGFLPDALSSVGVMHIMLDAALEIGAVWIPAGMAFGVFAVAAIGSVEAIVTHMTQLHTVMDATGAQIYPLAGGFKDLEASVKPQVYQLFGDALVVMSKNTGMFAGVAKATGTILDQLGARFTYAIESGGSMTQFWTTAEMDVNKLGDSFGSLFGIIGNLLHAVPGYAQILLVFGAAILHVIEMFTAAAEPVIHWGLILHGAIVYTGLAVTAIGVLAIGLNKLAASFLTFSESIASGSFIASIKEFAAVIGGMGIELVAFTIELYATAAAGDVFGAAMMLINAVPTVVWVVAAVAALAGLVLWLDHSSDAVTHLNTTLQTTIQNASLANLVTTITTAQATSAAQLATQTANVAVAQKAVNTATDEGTTGMAAHTGAISAQSAALSIAVQKQSEAQAGLQQISAQSQLVNTRMADLSTAYGGNTNAMGMLSAAGITTTQMLATGNNAWQQLKIQVEATSDAYKAMGQTGGLLGHDMDILGVQATTEYTAMQTLNTGIATFIANVIAAPQAQDAMATGMNTLATAATTANAKLATAQGNAAAAQYALNNLGTSASTVAGDVSNLGAAQNTLAGLQGISTTSSTALAAAQDKVAAAQDTLNKAQAGASPAETAADTDKLRAAQDALNIAQSAGVPSMNSMTTNGIALQNAFYGQVTSINTWAASLRTAGLSQSETGDAMKAALGPMLTYAHGSTTATNALYALAWSAGYTGKDSLKGLSEWVGKLGGNEKVIQTATDDASAAIVKQTTAAKNLASALSSDLSNAMALAVFQADGGQAAFTAFAVATKKPGESASDLQGRMDKLGSELLSTTGSAADARQQFYAFAAQLHLSNAEANTLWQSFAKQQLTALAAKAGTTEGAFLNFAEQLGLTKGAAEALWDQLGKGTSAQAAVKSATDAISGDFAKQADAAAKAQTGIADLDAATPLNGYATSTAAAARKQLTADLIAAGVNSTTAATAVDNYSQAVADNGADSTQAASARKVLITDILNAGSNAAAGQTALAKYTADIKDNQTKTASGVTDRNRLIKDLENAGLNAQEAGLLVQGLTTNLQTLQHGSPYNVKLTETGAGTFVINGNVLPTPSGGQNLANVVTKAEGGLITGGIPGRDSVLIRAMPGELVVPTALVNAGVADNLRGLIPGFAAGGLIPGFAAGGGVPGYAAGGLVGDTLGALTPDTQAFTASFNAAMTKAMETSMTGQLKTAEAAATIAQGTSKGDMSAAAIEALWVSVGGPASAAANMARIAYAESGDNPGITQAGEPPGLTGYGLFQITPTSGIDQNGAFGNLLNAANNARAALSLFNVSGYSPWDADAVGASLTGYHAASSPAARATAAAAPHVSYGEPAPSFSAAAGLLIPGMATGGTVRASLATEQTQVRNMYTALGRAAAAALATAPAKSHLYNAKVSVMDELATLQKEQVKENARYAALAGPGLTVKNLSYLGTADLSEVRTTLDADLLLAAPSWAGSLRYWLNAQAATAAGGPGSPAVGVSGTESSWEKVTDSTLAKADAKAGAKYLAAWEKTRKAPTLNTDIAYWTWRAANDTKLAGAQGLTHTLHNKYLTDAAADTKYLKAFTAEKKVMQGWGWDLWTADNDLSSWISAAGTTEALAENVKGWKWQRWTNQNTIAEIAKMVGPAPATAAATAAATTLKAVDLTAAGQLASFAKGLGGGGAKVMRGFGGFYDQGGWLPPGLSLAYNGTGQPERVTPPGGGPLTAGEAAIVAAIEDNTAVAGALLRVTGTQGQQYARALTAAAAPAAARAPYTKARRQFPL
jgi:hypothetical protein